MGGRYSALTKIHHPNSSTANEIFSKALCSSPSARIGITEIAHRDLEYPEHEKLAVEIILPFFNDPDVKVREASVCCFHYLCKAEKFSDDVDHLICEFIGSKAFFEFPYILYFPNLGSEV